MSAPKVEGVTVFVEDTFELDDMMMGAVVGSLPAFSTIWIRRSGGRLPRTWPPTAHDAADNLVLTSHVPRPPLGATPPLYPIRLHKPKPVHWPTEDNEVLGDVTHPAR